MKQLLYLLIIATFASAQVSIISTEKLPLPVTEQWSNPIFSPDGKEIFFTTAEQNGIWEYSLARKLLKEITRDHRSGFNFAISDDGSKLAYRRTVVDGDQHTRVQESVVLNLTTMSSSVIEKGNSIATPIFINNTVSTRRHSLLKKETVPHIIGIEDTKIVLTVNGTVVVIDPYKNGQYIWPQLSPDKSKIAAVEMDRGAFISDINGNDIISLGKCNAPQWLPSGKWIIGMDDKDDGHSINASELIAVSTDGKRRIQLTNTLSVIEMYPAVSPIENKIVLSTLNGDIILLTFDEAR